MHHRTLTTVAAGAVLPLAACSSSGATTAPTAAPTAAPPAASAEASVAAPAGAACAESSAAGEVAVTIKDFTFPADIQAKVGQTVTFTNGDSAPHTATLDDGSCTTPNIASGASDGLMFTVAGAYPFHCNVHPNMKGTITVS
jgi:plastocyanin